MKSLYSQFCDFHVFKKFKGLISSWWNIDVFLLEKTSLGFLLHEDITFNNSTVNTLLKSPLFKERFLKSIQENASPKEPSSLIWQQTGLEILAAPLLLGGRLEGYVVATGFFNPLRKERLEQALSYLKISKEETESQLSHLKPLKENDSDYVKKFLSILVEESFSLIQEKQRQERIIEQIKGDKVLTHYEDFIGKSAPMQFLYNILDKIKNYESSVLIQGESGTGKEILAKAIHKQSPRADKIFLAQSCSSLNNSLLESDLFGHAKGAFNGALESKKGLFEVADKGTLFLDEIGDLSLEIQSKLLRVLQDGTFFSLGSKDEKKVNIRVIASSNKNLEEMVEKGTFREDLFYRLNVINIKIPPLKERKEDIPLLVRHFLKEKDPLGKKQFTPKALECLYNYSWPGNIRELQNEIEKILVLSHPDELLLTEDSITKKIRVGETSTSNNNPFEFGRQSLKDFLRSVEKDVIIEALKKTNGNKTKVAKILQSSRTSIILKVKEYGLEGLTD